MRHNALFKHLGTASGNPLSYRKRTRVSYIGQVRLGGSVRNYFSVRNIWIWLATVNYRGKKVRTVDSPAVRSVNKSSDKRNCVQKRAKVCDLCPLRHSFIWQSPRNYFVCSDIANTRQLESSWRCQCEVTGHRKMSALGTAGAMVTTHENSVMMWSFQGTKLFSVL